MVKDLFVCSGCGHASRRIVGSQLQSEGDRGSTALSFDEVPLPAPKPWQPHSSTRRVSFIQLSQLAGRRHWTFWKVCSRSETIGTESEQLEAAAAAVSKQEAKHPAAFQARASAKLQLHPSVAS